MVAISLVALFIILFFTKIYTRQGEEYEMPDVEGKALAEVEEENDLELEFVVLDSIYQKGVPGGMIITQDPKGGIMVKKGRKVYVSITSFSAEDVVMPELTGLSVRQATSELYSNGLAVGRLTFVEDPFKNNVKEQSCRGRSVYAGQKIARGSEIDLVVGLGEGECTNKVPFVIGKTADKARRDIVTASLNVGREHFNGVKNKEKAVVYRQEPDYTGVNQYPFGTQVELWYIDADANEVDKMVSSFKVDSSKIVQPDDEFPTPDEIDNMNEIW
jgi:beta-lactam-binding protein with PASTA domain